MDYLYTFNPSITPVAAQILRCYKDGVHLWVSAFAYSTNDRCVEDLNWHSAFNDEDLNERKFIPVLFPTVEGAVKALSLSKGN